MVPAIEGRGALGGGPIEVRFVGGSMDFRAVVGAVVGSRVIEVSCLVGDLFGDLNQSAYRHKTIGYS